MKLFDCHNHIHLGPRGVVPLLESIPKALKLPTVDSALTTEPSAPSYSFAGAAIMSTHPRDYPRVDSVVSQLRGMDYKAVPCFGIHPWFLNEVLVEQNSVDSQNNYSESESNTASECESGWYKELKRRLEADPDAIVGEIGLDGARWVEVADDENDNSSAMNDKEEIICKRSRVLACPMDLQRKAFEDQLYLAAELNRPVSIHVVRAWGELFESFDAVRERMKQKYAKEEMNNPPDENNTKQSAKRLKQPNRLLLPPKIYFHAFSGKEGVIPSLLAACAKGNLRPLEDVFFGFAPAIPNFYAPKTPSVMKRIGIQQLLIETDLEDASNAWEDLIEGVEGLSSAFEMDVRDVADITYANAERFYFGVEASEK